ncbi:NmrA-like family domain-protein 1 [Diplogelasinospora grovesii]|uniref:NmrA-like family domain-protein 1 n=1 Tax=Diplogelasinospora grovesii TaxID=303347 RepID=A0AAN6S3K2_9PEZI|nr:NmrA-like family domain-protein 1 [Diplogelasinospora grovesii]
MAKALLITGATGKQGGAVIDALLDPNVTSPEFTILAVTRDASSTGAAKLAARSPRIKLVEGNLDHVPALFESAHRVNAEGPIWGVYSVQVSMGPGVTIESEVSQGKALIDCAIGAGVRHFVYSSVERGGDAASWDNPTPIPHFQSKYHIERHLREVTAPEQRGASMGWTILRPVAFMDNLAPGFPTKVFLAALRNHLQREEREQKSLQWVATADIGTFAAKAFANPNQWDRRAVGLAGDELTIDQLNESFVKATGQPAPFTYGVFGSALTYMVSEMGLMVAWFASDGYRADIQARRKEHRDMLTMEGWLKTKSGFKNE